MKQDDWQPLPNTKAVIGGSGVIVIPVDMTSFLDKEVSFALLTSFTEPIDGRNPDLRGTAPFVIHMSSKQVSAIPEMQRLTGKGTAASFAAGGFAANGQQH